jgi:hypothetical protein
MRTTLAPNAPKPAEYEPPKLRDWSDLVREVKLSMAVAAAVSTGRPELLRSLLARKKDAPPREQVTDEEIVSLIEMAVVLIETNIELQQHCAVLAQKAHDMRTTIHGLGHMLDKLDDWANDAGQGIH